jgi:hypothetical protein
MLCPVRCGIASRRVTRDRRIDADVASPRTTTRAVLVDRFVTSVAMPFECSRSGRGAMFAPLAGARDMPLR